MTRAPAPPEAEPEEQWVEELAAAEHPGLREHLGFFCTEGEDGLIYLGTHLGDGDLLVEQGCSVVAHWTEGQSQVELTVMRLSDVVAGRRPAGGTA